MPHYVAILFCDLVIFSLFYAAVFLMLSFKEKKKDKVCFTTNC